MNEFLRELGISAVNSGVYCGSWIKSPGGKEIESVSPVDGKPIARVLCGGKQDYEKVVSEARKAFEKWRMIPAPKRGEIIRLIGLETRKYKDALGQLVTLEMGKILTEGKGEVQEMIDICDFAVGLSRQLYGLTMHSERPGHRMYEQWHPLGTIGIITAFNFPVAVWAWNAMIAGVCGDAMIWKPSLKTPLTSIAVTRIVARVLEPEGLGGLMGMILGTDEEVGETMIHDRRLPLISATGSCRMGRHVGQVVAERLGRSLLELGGNNAVIIAEDADLKMALTAVLFGAVGTAGQRCTTTRRVFLHKKISATFTQSLVKAYGQVRIGNPLEAKTLMGPLIDQKAVEEMQSVLKEIRNQGGEILYGGAALQDKKYPGGCYVEPALIKASKDMKVVQKETFAPILYLIEVDSLEEAVAAQNAVDQGLSSAVFTNKIQSAEYFLSHAGSDCGIANVNIGTSGAEIGGAFGGEKDTGGGRESGSDAWKSYMRRQTNTINWSKDLPLAQGVEFDLD